MRVHFDQPVEESTLDLLDLIEEGCVRHSNTEGFQLLHTLVLDFPLASLSRPYYLKLRSIFPAVTSLALNFSRIKPQRRFKLIRFMENHKIGFKRLHTLHILSNGNYDYLGWLEDCRQVRTFNLSYLKMVDVKQLKVFLKVARARAENENLSAQDQLIRLEVSSQQYTKIQTLYARMLAQSFGFTEETNLRVVQVQHPRAITLVNELSQHAVDSI